MRKRRHTANIYQVKAKYARNEAQAQILTLTEERDALLAKVARYEAALERLANNYASVADDINDFLVSLERKRKDPTRV